MKFFLSLILCATIYSGLHAAQIPASEANKIKVTPEQAKNIVTGLVEQAIKDRVNTAKEDKKPKGIDDELALALEDISKLPSDSKEYARYITLYSMQHDPELVTKAYLAMTFWIHSLSNQNIIRLPQLVENSNGTLFRIDIRDYGWREQSWENVAFADPYIREPWINHETYNSLRLIAGNVLIRGDWFIDATASPVKQIDNDESTILYYELIYGKEVPKTIDDFRKFWRVDVPKIEGRDGKPSLVQQILVERGKSGVALNNRVLARAPTELGYYWETSDFKNSNGVRNVINNLYPGILAHPEADAGEVIASDLLGLQKYFIHNQDGKRVDFADPAVAFDRTNPRDVRVMTGRSCVECHAGGINLANNVLTNKIMVSNTLKFADYDFKLKADGAYFAQVMDRKTRKPVPRLTHLIIQDSDHYDQAIFNVNGLTAIENAANFRDILNWYNQDVTMEQAARECGLTIAEFQEKVRIGGNGQINALGDGETVSRAEWEAQQGLFQQSMLLITGNKTLKQEYGNISTETTLTDKDDRVLYIRTLKKTPLKVGNQVLASVPPDTNFEILQTKGDWYYVEFEGQKGYIHKAHVRLQSD